MNDRETMLEAMELLTRPTPERTKQALELLRAAVLRCEELDWNVD